MKRLSLFAICVLLVCLACAQVEAYTMTFDDAPPGGPDVLYYYWYHYGAHFGGFYPADHSNSSWGPPRSGTTVLASVWDYAPSGIMLKFHYGLSQTYYSIFSLGAYFSTQEGAVVRMEARRSGVSQPVASVLIGAPGQSRSNVYAEVSSPTAQIDFLLFYPVSTPDALTRFCADDMTVVPIPEPSSLIALAGGLAGLGGMALRRRRERRTSNIEHPTPN